MKEELEVRGALESDVPVIRDIYNYFTRETTFSYMERDFTEEEILTKYRTAVEKYPFLVAETGEGKVVGFAYAGDFRPQSAWKLVESTVYLLPGYEGRGTGKRLYDALIKGLKNNAGILGVVAMISLDNRASIAFHELLGFELAGKWENCAIKFGKTLGTGCWMLRLG